MRIFKKITSQIKGFGKKVDNYQEAITFAEAGEYEHAAGSVKDKEKKITKEKVLLVIGRQASFPDEMVDYAIGMAKRLSYNIHALNAASLDGEKAERFKQEAEKNKESFQALADKNNIPFTHQVKFTDIENGIKETAKELGTIDFVISESINGETVAADRNQPENRASNEIFVYSMA